MNLLFLFYQHFANGNGSTRRYGHPEIERAIGGSYVTMPPQISIPRVRHPNQVNYAIHRGQIYSRY